MASTITTGSVIGGYTIRSSIAESPMAAVFLADAPDGERVALKVLGSELAADDRFRRRFLRESEVAAGLHHPHIVPTLASGEDDGVPYLAMAYVDGSDLRQLLRRDGALEPRRACDLLAQAAAAVDAAHAAGLVHRDLKPGNILVESRPDGEHAYVCDFGLARHLSSPSSLTGDRGFVGTVDYIPPEQIEGGPLDARADVYSLGCVLFECLAGQRPFERASELALIYAHLNDDPPRMTSLRPELPREIDDVLATALAKRPADRHASCGELIEAARAALAGVPHRRPRPGRRRRVAVAAAALLAAVAAGIAGYAATRGGESAAGPPAITPTSIAGAKLGLAPAAYKKRFGPYKSSTLSNPPGYPELQFGTPRVAVYFPAAGKSAHIITTWNRSYRTAAGIGPCSTIAELKKAYGSAVKPSPNGTGPDGKIWQWTVGPTLVFAGDQKTISTVALYEGSAADQSLLGWAGYVAANEEGCK